MYKEYLRYIVLGFFAYCVVRVFWEGATAATKVGDKNYNRVFKIAKYVLNLVLWFTICEALEAWWKPEEEGVLRGIIIILSIGIVVILNIGFAKMSAWLRKEVDRS